MIITNSRKISENSKISRNHGITRTLNERYSVGYPWEYDVKEFGYNYRIDEMRSTLGINQLKRINKINSSRRKSFRYYNKLLSKVDGILLPDLENLQENSCHLYRIGIDKKQFGIDRNTIFKKLAQKNIITSVHYKPLSLFTIFKKKAKIYSPLHNSLEIYKNTLSLPFYTNISKSEQEKVVKALITIKN